MKVNKVAVVLFNLGGPLKKEDIRPFLFNFFMDENIIRAPKFIRYFLAKYISIKRSGDKSSYKFLGWKSPLLDNSLAQVQDLQNLLNEEEENEYKVFLSMRYWLPLTSYTAAEVKAYNPDKVILLPLYPQYSTTTTKSSFDEWYKFYPDKDKCVEITSYEDNKEFIKASAYVVRKGIEKTKGRYRLLFSAHGLPVNIIRAGDPYQRQCEITANKIAEELGIEELDWQLCYQSKVGPMKWLEPSINQALHQAKKDGVGVVVYPIAFVSEHVETLVELDIEYKEVAEELGLNFYIRVPTVSVHPQFIEALRDLVVEGK